MKNRRNFLRNVFGGVGVLIVSPLAGIALAPKEIKGIVNYGAIKEFYGVWRNEHIDLQGSTMLIRDKSDIRGCTITNGKMIQFPSHGEGIKFMYNHIKNFERGIKSNKFAI